MKRTILRAIVVVLASMLVSVVPGRTTPKVQGQDNPVVLEGYTFTTIDFPGAISTLLAGINPGGDIVGHYLGADNKIHGGLLSGGDFISFDVGDGSTCNDCNTVEKSNPSGDIVGNYTVAGVTHGYLMSGGPGGSFTTIDFPGAGVTRTAALGISPERDIVGNYTVAGVKHGYLLSGGPGGSFTTIDFPGASVSDRPIRLCPGTCALAINPRGDITGAYSTADGVVHAYLLRGGQFTSFEFPGAVFTNANAINPRGDIVGRYDSADGRTHGYLLSGSQFTSIDFPGTTFTTANGINPRGDIVGKYKTPDGEFHGFLLSR